MFQTNARTSMMCMTTFQKTADIPFKVSDRIHKNPNDLDVEEDSEDEYDPKKRI